MKKFLSFVLVVLAFSFTACDKERGSEDAQGNPSGQSEGNGDEFPEIQTIDMPSSLAMDIDWEGQMLPVTISPENATSADLEAQVEDESIVSATKSGDGFLIKPLKVGSTKVKVRATRGGAASKFCSVTVNEKGITQAVEITKCELLSSDSADKRVIQDYVDSYREAYFKVKLTPSTAKLSEDMVWSPSNTEWVESMAVDTKNYGNGVYGFKVKVRKNTGNLSSRVGSMNINFVPKKGSGKLSVPINVRGHIYKVSFVALSATSSKYIENGEVFLNGGEYITLTPTIDKTGTLLDSDDLQFNVSSSYGLSIDSKYKLSLSSSPSSYSGNSGVNLVCSDKTGALSPVNIKVHTYAVPTGISISKVSDGKATYLKGDEMTFNVSVSPSSARQKWNVVSGLFDVVSHSSSQLKIKWTANGRVDPYQVKVSTLDGKYSKSVDVVVCTYKASDAKIGDYVIYNTSTKKFRLVDGGVRATIGGSSTKYSGDLNGPGSLGSTEKVVGIVFTTVSSSDLSNLKSKYSVSLQGFTNSSEHVCIVSTTDAASWVWSSDSDSKDNIDGIWKGSEMNGKYGTSPCRVPNTSYVVSVYEASKGWNEYNDIRGTSHRVKAVYAANDYKTPCDLSGAATTGWLLPMFIYDGQEKMIINERLVKISGAQKLDGSYWTACYYDASNAYYQDIANSYYEKGKKNSEKKGRPVLYL